MKQLLVLLSVILPGAAVFAAEDQGIHFVANHLTIPLEVGQVIRASDPPEFTVDVYSDDRKDQLRLQLKEPDYKRLRNALQDRRITQILTDGPGEPPSWFRGEANKMVAAEPGWGGQLYTNYGPLTVEQTAELQNYIAGLAVQQIQMSAARGEPLKPDPVIAAKVETGMLDITQPINLLRAIGTAHDIVYATDQGSLTLDELNSFKRAHDEWRVRHALKEINAEYREQSALEVARQLPGFTSAMHKWAEEDCWPNAHPQAVRTAY